MRCIRRSAGATVHPKCGDQPMLDAGSYLLLYSGQVSSLASKAVSPEHSVVRRIDGFKRNFNIFACDNKMTGDYVRHTHFLGSFL